MGGKPRKRALKLHAFYADVYLGKGMARDAREASTEAHRRAEMLDALVCDAYGSELTPEDEEETF